MLVAGSLEYERTSVDPLEKRFPDVRFYNPNLTEVQDEVAIDAGGRREA